MAIFGHQPPLYLHKRPAPTLKRCHQQRNSVTSVSQIANILQMLFQFSTTLKREQKLLEKANEKKRLEEEKRKLEIEKRKKEAEQKNKERLEREQKEAERKRQEAEAKKQEELKKIEEKKKAEEDAKRKKQEEIEKMEEEERQKKLQKQTDEKIMTMVSPKSSVTFKLSENG